jgi:hypothetical protein
MENDVPGRTDGFWVERFDSDMPAFISNKMPRQYGIVLRIRADGMVQAQIGPNMMTVVDKQTIKSW